MNTDMTYCNHYCANMECERNILRINAPGYYTFSDLSETELCIGWEEQEDG